MSCTVTSSQSLKYLIEYSLVLCLYCLWFLLYVSETDLIHMSWMALYMHQGTLHHISHYIFGVFLSAIQIPLFPRNKGFLLCSHARHMDVKDYPTFPVRFQPRCSVPPPPSKGTYRSTRLAGVQIALVSSFCVRGIFFGYCIANFALGLCDIPFLRGNRCWRRCSPCWAN